MKNILLLKSIVLIGVLIFTTALVHAGDWNSSPNNWKNNESNWDNNSNNWKNSPNNWQNSPNKYGNENLIYDGSGNASGYAVPNSSGGTNMYDFDGNRQGYVPGR
jgi:hypothetical protein